VDILESVVHLESVDIVVCLAQVDILVRLEQVDTVVKVVHRVIPVLVDIVAHPV
jgi:hypothetical protein